MASPVLVHGDPVPNPHMSQGGVEITQHTKQAKCQDPLFAPLFYIDIIAVVALAGGTGDEWVNNSAFAEEYMGYYYASIIGGIVGLIMSGVMLQVMFCIPSFLIKASLIFTVVMSALMVVFSFSTQNVLGVIMSLLFFALTCCYAYCVWSRIPFATANLVTAMTAVKANCGITVAAYIMAALAALWSFVWAVAFMGLFDSVYTCTNPNIPETCVIEGSGWGYLFLLFLAYFFSHQVIQNTIHVTIAGVVATWWIAPDEASSCCSVAIFDSLKRSLTTSFGSICYGSLLVAIIQALRALANTARSQDDNFLRCLAECILSCIESKYCGWFLDCVRVEA
jgi:Plasma-membrane choline transporter